MSCIRITARNAGPEPAELHILPTLWFRNRWSWEDGVAKPVIRDASERDGLGRRSPRTRSSAHGSSPPAPIPRAAAVASVLRKRDQRPERLSAATPRRPTRRMGSTTTSSMARRRSIPNGAGRKWRAGIASRSEPERPSSSGCGSRATRRAGRSISARPSRKRRPTGSREADEYYAALRPQGATDEEAMVMRQAFAGMIWSLQFYHYDVPRWLEGDKVPPA